MARSEAGGVFRKVKVRMWRSGSFSRLSRLPPSGQSLWLYLLTCPESTALPGVIVSGRAAMAEALRWDLKAFDEAFGEAFAEGMVEADWESRLVWLLRGPCENPPQNPNVVKSWAHYYRMLPDCELKERIRNQFRAFMVTMGKAFVEAFDEAFPKALGKGLPKAFGKGYVHQEQEQESIRRTPKPPTANHADGASPDGEECVDEDEEEDQQLPPLDDGPEEPQRIKPSQSSLSHPALVAVAAGRETQPAEALPSAQKRGKGLSAAGGGGENVEREFGVWWVGYPRKVSKEAALRAWRKLGVKERAECVARTPAWVAAHKVAGTEVGFMPHPATYLNGKRWQDDLGAIVPKRGGNGRARGGQQEQSLGWHIDPETGEAVDDEDYLGAEP